MKKILLRFAIALIVLVAALAAGTWFCLHRKAPDGPPPDDAALEIARAEVPQDQNAYTIFCTMTNMWFRKEEYIDRLDELLDGRTWDESLVQRIVDTNQGMFFSMEEGLKWPHCQVPEVRNVGTSTAYLEEWRRIAKLMQLRSRLFLVKGKHVQAYEQAVAVVHFGQRIENTGGSVLHYLIGLSIKHMGLMLIEQMLPYLKPDTTQFRIYAEKLADFDANEAALVDALKREYMSARNTVTDLAEGRLSLKDAGVAVNPLLSSTGITPYLLQVNDTQQRFADFFTRMIDAVPFDQTESAKRLPRLSRENPSAIEAFTKPNYIGRRLAQTLLPPSITIVERKNGEQLYVDSVRLRLLLIAYEMENRSPPTMLEDLVDHGLDTVPTDPYDGKPIRYSAEKRILYSVGRDLKDSNGSSAAPSAPAGLPDQQKRWIAEDIVFEF